MNGVGNLSLADLTCEQLCLPHVRGRDAATVLHELSCAFEAARIVPAAMPVFDVALTRYYLAPDDQTGAVAYPMACLPSPLPSTLAVGAIADGCSWRPTTPPARMVFLIATTARDAALAAAIVQAVKRAVAEPAGLRRLQDAATATAMRAALAAIPLDGTHANPAADCLAHR